MINGNYWIKTISLVGGVHIWLQLGRLFSTSPGMMKSIAADWTVNIMCFFSSTWPSCCCGGGGGGCDELTWHSIVMCADHPHPSPCKTTLSHQTIDWGHWPSTITGNEQHKHHGQWGTQKVLTRSYSCCSHFEFHLSKENVCFNHPI